MEPKYHFNRGSRCKHDLNFECISVFADLLKRVDTSDTLEVAVHMYSGVRLGFALNNGRIECRVLVLAWDERIPFL